jgi:hypothetical protein
VIPENSLTTVVSRLREMGKSLAQLISSPQTKDQYVLTSQIGTTRSTNSFRKDSDVPAVVYYTVTRTQKITVASAYGEVNAIRAGVAAMDEDMTTLNELSGATGLPEGHYGPVATVRGRPETVSIWVEANNA